MSTKKRLTMNNPKLIISIIGLIFFLAILSVSLTAGVSGHYVFDGPDGEQYYINRDQLIHWQEFGNKITYRRNGMDVTIDIVGDPDLDDGDFATLETAFGVQMLAHEHFNYASLEGGLPFVFPKVFNIPRTDENVAALLAIPNTRACDRFRGEPGEKVLVNVELASVYTDPALPGRLIGAGPQLIDSPQNRNKLGISP